MQPGTENKCPGKQKSHSAVRNAAVTSTNAEAESVSKVRELTWCPTYRRTWVCSPHCGMSRLADGLKCGGYVLES